MPLLHFLFPAALPTTLDLVHEFMRKSALCKLLHSQLLLFRAACSTPRLGAALGALGAAHRGHLRLFGRIPPIL